MVIKMKDGIYKCMLFDGIEKTEADMVLSMLGAVSRRFSKGSTIFEPGKNSGTLGIVIMGQIQIIKEDYWGNRTIISDMREGDMFGEASCCDIRELVPFSVVAVSDADIMTIEHSRLFCGGKLPCSCHNRLLYNLTRSLAAKNNTLSRKISHITERSTRDKLMSYLSEQAYLCGRNSFKIPIDRQELADYLSVDRSAMSNELSKMRREGLIDYRKNSFKFL